MKNCKLKIALLCGGPSNEFDVSVMTAKEIDKSLDKKKYDVVNVLIGKDLTWQIDSKEYATNVALKYLKKNTDLAIIAMHGKFGEDGELQSLLDSIKLPYLGSGIQASHDAMDKKISNEFYEKSGLLVPKSLVVDGKKPDELEKIHSFPLSFVIKPLKGGSSIGVSIIKDKNEIENGVHLAMHDEDQLLVQEYVAGRELTCGVIEKEGTLIPLVPTEIILTTSKFFDYKAKYTESGCEEITPPKDLPPSVYKEVQRQSLEAHKSLGCRTFSRSDFILSSDGKLYILETNTIPGMTEFSLLPKGARAMGVKFSELLDIFIDSIIKNFSTDKKPAIK